MENLGSGGCNLGYMSKAVLRIAEGNQRFIRFGNIGPDVRVVLYIFISYHLLCTFSAKPKKSFI